jgi:hypothetical protein
MRLLQAMFDRERPSFMCCFVIGPSFAEAALMGLLATLAQFPEAADALLSGFLACSRRVFSLIETGTSTGTTGSTSSAQHQAGPGMITSTTTTSSSSSTASLKRSLSASAEADYAYSAKAVKALRDRSTSSSSMADDSCQATKPNNNMDQVLTMVLGLGVLTFDLLDLGLNAHSICRCTLGLIGPGYPMDAQEKALPLIYMDTCNCLVRRQVPVHRLGTGEMGRVDRYIGLCLSLLPIMYDLCCITSTYHGQSYTNSGRGETRQGQGDDVRKSLLDVLEKTVREWKPPLARMADTTAKLKLTQREVQVIATQAAVYRSAILLFIRRLRLTFAAEEDDMEANFMASSILDDIRSLYRSSSNSSTGSVSASLRGEGWMRDETWLFEYRMGLPFLIAAVELQNKTQRAQALELLQWVVCKRMYPQVGDRLRQFILFVWEARDHGFGGHWIDLTAHGPQFVLF